MRAGCALLLAAGHSLCWLLPLCACVCAMMISAAVVMHHPHALPPLPPLPNLFLLPPTCDASSPRPAPPAPPAPLPPPSFPPRCSQPHHEPCPRSQSVKGSSRRFNEHHSHFRGEKRQVSPGESFPAAFRSTTGHGKPSQTRSSCEEQATCPLQLPQTCFVRDSTCPCLQCLC
jgi:hypothetical protein